MAHLVPVAQRVTPKRLRVPEPPAAPPADFSITREEVDQATSLVGWAEARARSCFLLLGPRSSSSERLT
eukprot:10968298-Alexandrium_andersonii.AAC.1